MAATCVHLGGIPGMRLCWDNTGNACTLAVPLGASSAERTTATMHFVWPPYCRRRTSKFDA